MKKYFWLLLVFAMLTMTLAGCSGEQKTVNSDNSAGSPTALAKNVVPDKVEVYLFHATQRCTTCIAIGKLAGETVAEYFQAELRDGKIEFREINIDLPENKELAQKFQASGSTLKINVISGGQDEITEDTAVWRLTSNPEQFKSYLKDKLNNNLGK